MWEDLELDPESIPTLKLIFHSAQIVCAFVSWCLEIAVFRADDSKVVGNNGWTFAVVRASPATVLKSNHEADLSCLASSSSPFLPGST